MQLNKGETREVRVQRAGHVRPAPTTSVAPKSTRAGSKRMAPVEPSPRTASVTRSEDARAREGGEEMMQQGRHWRPRSGAH